MRIFDTFTYFNEKYLLRVRCEELKHLNPIHVLVEATSTHTGDPKPLHFDEIKDEFSDYNIIHVVTGLPNTGDPWRNENYQRDCIAQALVGADDDDVIIISDVDEIPRWQAVQFYDKQMGIVSL